LIETVNLTKKFGDLTAVDNVTLWVDEGEVFGFLGPNGARKTTTVRMLCCLISKTSGEARIGDYDVGEESDSLKIRRLIGLVPDSHVPLRRDTHKVEVAGAHFDYRAET